MSYVEKMKTTRSLLLDAQTGRAAAYTANHRLVVELASKKLVDFVLAHESKREPFNEARHDPTGLWRPLPAWATDEVRARCVLVWMDRGDGSDEFFRSIPKR